MNLRTRVTVVVAAAAAGAGLLSAPAHAATLISTFANSEAGGIFCHAVENYFEQKKAQEEGHSGDWYYCEQTPTNWNLYER
ncbi:hypothetical protein [Sphaerisporangium rhizosphaerae]|uniref:Uncharacterized protein n=1 Tax=Sphaerisporangium rhizosphaerae TaxID=2269375 RepID=A0ABW2PJL1_9ACTN